jgi:hypothetical protein
VELLLDEVLVPVSDVDCDEDDDSDVEVWVWLVDVCELLDVDVELLLEDVLVADMLDDEELPGASVVDDEDARVVGPPYWSGGGGPFGGSDVEPLLDVGLGSGGRTVMPTVAASVSPPDGRNFATKAPSLA